MRWRRDSRRRCADMFVLHNYCFFDHFCGRGLKPRGTIRNRPQNCQFAWSVTGAKRKSAVACHRPCAACMLRAGATPGAIQKTNGLRRSYVKTDCSPLQPL
jgi:hypothetical protein